MRARRETFLLGTDQEAKQRLKSLLRDLEINNEVNAVLLINTADAFTAAELLLLGGTIDAQASCQMVLVNKVFPPARFEADCIDWVHSMLRLGTKHIPYTRNLLYKDCPTFDAYLQKESNIRLKAFNRKHIF